jgi:hypothetical protein
MTWIWGGEPTEPPDFQHLVGSLCVFDLSSSSHFPCAIPPPITGRAAQSERSARSEYSHRLRESLAGRKLIIGADRPDGSGRFIFYELIVGHDRFNADLRPLFYKMQSQPEGMCCHPYDCAALLIAEEAGVIITDAHGKMLNGPLDCTTGISWVGYANQSLREQIEPLVKNFILERG